MHLTLTPEVGPGQLKTLADALPARDGPPIILSGPVPEGAAHRQLARLFTHPGLVCLTLDEPALDDAVLEAMADAVRRTGSPLTSLTWIDDSECLLCSAFAGLLGQLGQFGSLRHLNLDASSTDEVGVSQLGEGALQLAEVLLSLRLDTLQLHQMGSLMDALCRAWPTGHPVAWRSLGIHGIDLGELEAAFITPLAVFLARCTVSPDLQALQLGHFFVDPGMDLDGAGTPRLSSTVLGLVNSLSIAVRQRHLPLDLAVGTGDLEVLGLLMDGLTGDPHGTALDPSQDGEASESVEAGVTCIRSLQLDFSPDIDGPADAELLSGALQTLAGWIGECPRLESLHLGVKPRVDGGCPVALIKGLAEGLAQHHTMHALAGAVHRTRITQLVLEGPLLQPVPAALQPCVQRVTQRALLVSLEVRALDSAFGFLQPGQHLPTDVGALIVGHWLADPGLRHPVGVLPLLDRSALLNHVDRCNVLAAAAPPGDRPLPHPLTHPLTSLAMEIRGQADGATGLR
ncbi:MAG: hypothetical protein C0451_12125 [Comamonadaceae bacterium]|nr:hypothetical protein [Comamonadaceae bacterium]